MKIAIIINSQRLTSELKTKLEDPELSEKYNISYDLFIPEPKDLEKTLLDLNHEAYNACLIGGGDGTVRTAAQVLMNTNLPLIVLPLGTFNILAKSLEYPNDIDKLFEMIKNHKTKQIDLAEVNNIIFTNHAWLGFYTSILKIREKHKDILGRSRFLKALFNAFWVFKKIPIYEFEVKLDNQSHTYKTCLISISNNESTTQLFNLGQRPLLATGLLYVNILRCQSRWQLVACMLSVVFFGLKNSKQIKQFVIDELSIKASTQQANIVLDGELLKIKSPLKFTNHKNKLDVIIA